MNFAFKMTILMQISRRGRQPQRGGRTLRHGPPRSLRRPPRRGLAVPLHHGRHRRGRLRRPQHRQDRLPRVRRDVPRRRPARDALRRRDGPLPLHSQPSVSVHFTPRLLHFTLCFRGFSQEFVNGVASMAKTGAYGPCEMSVLYINHFYTYFKCDIYMYITYL